MTGRERQWLIIVYGSDRPERTAVAEGLAGRLPGKTALVRINDLQGRWIVRHDDDALAELEMVYMQVKLLVSHYLRNRYHVIVDGPYVWMTDGRRQSFEDEIDQLQMLMRAMPVQPLTVHIRAGEAGDRADGMSGLDTAYRRRTGPGDLQFNITEQAPSAIVEEVMQAVGRV